MEKSPRESIARQPHAERLGGGPLFAAVVQFRSLRLARLRLARHGNVVPRGRCDRSRL